MKWQKNSANGFELWTFPRFQSLSAHFCILILTRSKIGDHLFLLSLPDKWKCFLALKLMRTCCLKSNYAKTKWAISQHNGTSLFAGLQYWPQWYFCSFGEKLACPCFKSRKAKLLLVYTVHCCRKSDSKW